MSLFLSLFLHHFIVLQTVYSLVDLSSDHGCFNSSAYTNDTNVKDSVVGVARGVCTFSEKAMMAQRYGAAGILIVSTQKVEYQVT